MTILLTSLIAAYQRISRALIAIGFGPLSHFGCRQWPTCSEFGIEAIRHHGPTRGLMKTAIRIARCHPL